MSRLFKIILVAGIFVIAGMLVLYQATKSYTAHNIEKDKSITVPDSDAYAPKYK